MKKDFELKHGEAIAALAYRTHPPGPWVGRESELVDALNSAKLHHDLTLEMSAEDNKARATTAEARKSRDKIKQFTNRLMETTDSWKGLQPEAKKWLAEAFRDRVSEYDKLGSSFHALLDKADDFPERLKQVMELPTAFEVEAMDAVDSLFSRLGELAEHLKSKPACKPGEKGYLQGLAAFIEGLEDDWDAEKLGTEFSPEFDKESGEPLSAAALLVFHAAQYLDKNYTAKNCQNAWRPRRSDAPRNKGARLKHKWPS